MRIRVCVLFILVLFLTLPAVAGDINSSIRISSGDIVDDDISTLNGSIRVGDGATLNGDATSVNGGVEVGINVRMQSVSAVNGTVEIGSRTMVTSEVETVNGSISMARGSSAGSVGTVNGSVDLDGVDVEGDVSTYNGNVTLSDGTTVGGNLVIKDTNSKHGSKRQVLRIVIEEGSVVQGDVIVEGQGSRGRGLPEWRQRLRRDSWCHDHREVNDLNRTCSVCWLPRHWAVDRWFRSSRTPL